MFVYILATVRDYSGNESVGVVELGGYWLCVCGFDLI